ncbi:HypC/HybG/HupF family hydrogenase formation chaperone [Helicobacter sp.]|uniref:HypC/HybG/HupF family hydrogenase formation chaperone n=1 Tax=Helicobacter sp. TaxID=218 RepID=UPI0025BF8748|nr:HypC/HybG/HupF family hydrogenase formation chaperone [Helicobacter sp.]MCI5968091.1 HypC/HybG/HupF family hydrogenase formation chaperone [Helicobacter sp.]MDY2584099.1 HypC/HybG/HupF family hydrogenase formation chaperone [Helicobacter sp.]
MCLAIPSKVVSIDKESNMATLDTLGVTREASLDLMSEEVSIGDYVLLHIGYVMGKIDAEQAKLSLETYAEIIKAIEEEEAELRSANNGQVF